MAAIVVRALALVEGELSITCQEGKALTQTPDVPEEGRGQSNSTSPNLTPEQHILWFEITQAACFWPILAEGRGAHTLAQIDFCTHPNVVNQSVCLRQWVGVLAAAGSERGSNGWMCEDFVGTCSITLGMIITIWLGLLLPCLAIRVLRAARVDCLVLAGTSALSRRGTWVRSHI